MKRNFDQPTVLSNVGSTGDDGRDPSRRNADAAEDACSAVRVVGKLASETNYLTFDAIYRATGLSTSQILQLKIALEEYLRALPGESPFLRVTSRVDLDPPGYYFED